MIPILKQTLSKLQGAGRIKIGVATQTTVNPEEESQSSFEDYTDETCEKGEKTNQDIEGSG